MLPLVELICVGTVTTCSPTFWVLHNLDFLSPNSDLLDILPQPMQKTSLLLEPNQTHSTNPEPTQWIFSRIYFKFYRIFLPSNLWHWSRLCPRQWNVAQDTAWAVQVFTATCRVIISIDMDDTRMLHFQQDYLGCVDDEANIVKKCDARRQVYSDNNFSSLSRWLGRLMSIPMTMTVADQRAKCICLREHLVLLWRAEQVRQIWWDVCTVLRCLLPMHICSWIRQVYPELCFPAAIATLLIKQRKGMQEFISQKIYRTRGRDSRRRSATKGTRRIKSCTTFPSLLSSSCKHAQSTLYEPS